MPIYEYACGKCGKTIDVLQRLTDPPLRKCPACGSRRLRKQLSAPVVHLKSRKAAAPVLVPQVAGGRSALDGTRPLNWPSGRLVGVKKTESD